MAITVIKNSTGPYVLLPVKIFNSLRTEARMYSGIYVILGLLPKTSKADKAISWWVSVSGPPTATSLCPALMVSTHPVDRALRGSGGVVGAPLPNDYTGPVWGLSGD